MITFNVPEIPFFIFLGVLGIMFPIGIYHFSKFITTIIKVRRGYQEVELVQKNHQRSRKLEKPLGNKIKVEGEDKPFENDPEHYVLEGSKKVVAFTRLKDRLEQLSFTGGDRSHKGEMPENLFNDALHESEEWGKRQGFEEKKWKDIALIGAVILGVIAVVGLFYLNGTVTSAISLSNTTNNLVTTLTGKVDTLISNQATTSIPANITVLNR